MREVSEGPLTPVGHSVERAKIYLHFKIGNYQNQFITVNQMCTYTIFVSKIVRVILRNFHTVAKAVCLFVTPSSRPGAKRGRH